MGSGSQQSPSKGSFTSSMAWLPVLPSSLTGAPGLGVLAHELGHNLGLNHSSTADYDAVPLGALAIRAPASDWQLLPTLAEYGDPFSAMGSSSSGHYTAEHKSLILDWLTPSNYQEIMSPGTFNVQPLEATADPRALRTLRDPASGAWLWLEYRQPIDDVDRGLGAINGTNVFEGALIHYENPALDSPRHSYLLDFNPAMTPNSFANAALGVGQSWSDPYSPLTLTVNSSSSSSGLSVTVDYDQPCVTLRFSSTSFPSSGGTGSIDVAAPQDCAWTASTTANWIALREPASVRAATQSNSRSRKAAAPSSVTVISRCSGRARRSRSRAAARLS